MNNLVNDYQLIMEKSEGRGEIVITYIDNLYM